MRILYTRNVQCIIGVISPCGIDIYKLYCESVKIRDLDGRGPWAVASERSEDATKGPRLSKSRIFIGRAV